VNYPTRFQNNHSSAIDNIFVNNSWLHLCSILPIYNGLSDHDAQCLILKKVFVKNKIMSGKFKTRLFTADTISYFQELLLEETWEVIYQEHYINEIFNNFLRIYLSIFKLVSLYFIMVNIKTMLGLQRASEYHVNGKEVCIFSVEFVMTWN
jgi:hypothetical protein